MSAQLNCQFSSSALFGCPPLVVNFTDQSTGNPTTYWWDFDNGNTSTNQNPTTSYSAAGIYNVIHAVSDGVSSDTQVLQIRVFLPATVNFTSADNHGCIFPCHTVNFTNQTIPGESPVTQYVWDYGDGSLPQTGYNTSHCYNTVGSYDVTLVARDSNNCQTSKILPGFVVIGLNPQANATANPTQSCNSPQVVSFTGNGTSSNGVLTYNWYFGNGGNSSLQNPTNVYVSGIYDPMLIVTDTLGCQDTAFLQISVTDVDAGFTATSNNACNGVPIQFTDTSNFATSWQWNFGDGNSSTQQNPLHTYTANGTYTVTLTVTYGPCTDTETQTNYITVTDPVAFTFSADDTLACTAPHTVNFTSNVSGVAGGYLWDFGDGTTSTSANPSHTYTANGTYTVTLSVANSSGCYNTQTLSTSVTVGSLQASFTIDSTMGCTPLTVRFTNTSVSNVPITSFEYFFGDGTFSTGANPVHIYNAAGQYTPELIVTNAEGCIDTFTYSGTINVGQSLNPSFTATPLVQCVNQLVTFTNLTQGGSASTIYTWDFGDGTTSNLVNPTHAYTDTGFYDITLTVINQGCSNDTIKIRYIEIVVPKADFYFDFDCTNPTTVAFYDTSQGADTWLWDFGDGTSSNQQNPVHTFPSQAIYTVQLTVTNFTTGCTDSLVRDIPIGTPNAGFTADTFSGCMPLQVRFTDTSTFASSWLWYFGDGSTSTLQNPAHIYTDTGRYTVSLVINPVDSCSDSITYTNYITVYGIKSKIGADPISGCVPLTVNFTDTSSSYMGSIVSYLWTFNTGDSSFVANPTYTFDTARTFSIRLITTDSRGCSATASRFITTYHVTANFISDTAVCPGEVVNFINLSTGGASQFVWDFGDGTTSTQQSPSHFYTNSGNYSVSLISTRTNPTCSDTLVIPNFLNVDTPVADFFVTTTFAPCPPFPVQFFNTTNRTDLNWLWRFGDGDTSTAYNPLHVYFFPGDYDVTLVSWDSSGCFDSITYVDLIRVRGPVGNFTATPDSGCVPLTISISGTTQSTVSMVADLGDGTAFQDSINVSHTYGQEGYYYPVYTLTDSVGCTVAYPVDTIVVGLIPYPGLPDDTTVCRGNYVQFDLLLGDHFQWSANQTPNYLNCDTCSNPVASALDTITYYVTASTNIGCVASDTIVVNVDALPLIFPGIAFRICPNDTLQLSAGPNVASAFWSPNLYMDDSTIVNPLVWPPDSMIYRVTGFNSTGCSISRIVRVWVIQDVVAELAVTDTLVCDGGRIQLGVKVLEASVNDTSFQWRPATYLNSSIIDNPVLDAPTGDYLYTVIVSSNTCKADTDTVHVTIAPNPSVEAGDNQTVTEGTEIRLYASSPDDVTYEWQPKDAMTCTDCRLPYLTATQNQTIPVIVTNQWGCKDTAYVEIKVVSCDPEMIFVPNTFTPNNDGLNDVLRVRGIGLRSLEYFRVFDRWGKLVYTTTNLSEGWDGKISGKEADVATYVYLAKGVCSNGHTLEKSGNVTLVR